MQNKTIPIFSKNNFYMQFNPIHINKLFMYHNFTDIDNINFRKTKIDWNKYSKNIIKFSKEYKKNKIKLPSNKELLLNQNLINENLINTFKKQIEKNFWIIINKLKWRDSDEERRNIFYIRRYLSNNEIRFIYNHFPLYANKLEEKLILDINNIEKKNLLYHIIARGYNYYNAVLNEPELCLYLRNNNLVQPLYSMLVNLTNRHLQ